MLNGYNANIRPQYPVYVPQQQTRTNNYTQNTTQNRAVYSSPVYYTPPYGIHQNNYIKIGIQKTPNGQEFHIYQLKSGQKVAIAKSSGMPRVETMVDIGSLDERSDKNGISHLLEHSIFHGSKKYGNDLENKIDELGAKNNAATSKYSTQYYYVLDNNNPENLKKAIDLQADMILNPTFSNLDKEKLVVSKEADEDSVKEDNILNNSVLKNLYSLQEFTSADVISGSPETIASITQQDLFDFHSMYYRPENLSTVVISNSNPDDVIKMVSDSFTQAAEGKIYSPTIARRTLKPTNTMQRCDYISKDDTKGRVSFAFALPTPKTAQEEQNIKAMIELVGLRCGIYGALIKTDSNFSTIQFNSNLLDVNENDRLQQLKEGIDKALLNPPTEHELKCIKNILKELENYSYKDNEETSNSVLRSLTFDSNINFVARMDAINNLSSDGVVSALKYLDINRCSMGVLHPVGTTPEQIQENYKQSQSYIAPVILPKYTQQIDISNSIEMHNIEPYTSMPVRTTVLPDNTNLAMVDSKTDKCTIKWELFNPNAKITNPALTMVLEEMTPVIMGLEQIKEEETGSSSYANFLYNNSVEFGAQCPVEALQDAMMNMRKYADFEFTEEHLKKAKENVAKRITNIKDSAYTKKVRFEKGSAYSCNQEEQLAALEALTLNDLKNHFNDMMNNSYSTVVVSAPFSQQPQLINQVASGINIPNFSFKKADEGMFEKTYVPKDKSICYLAEEKVEQPTYSQLYSFKITGNTEDNLKLNLLGKILRERLSADIRKGQGQCYTPQAYFDKEGNTGEINISVTSSSSSKEDIQNFFNSFDRNVNSLKNGTITEAELNKAKSALRIAVYSLFDDEEEAQDEIISRLRNPGGLSSMKDVIKIIDSITVDDIRAAAQYAFSEKPDFLVDASAEVLEANKDYFATLGDIK